MSLENYILDGKTPILEPDILKWAKWFEHSDKRVAKSFIGEILISTVFLGIDHDFRSQGPPLLFETRISGSEKFENFQERYSTWEEAEKGHQQAVAQVEKAIGWDV